MASSSFFSQILEPGGGVMLLPFVRVVIGLLLILTLLGAMVDIARIHMIILSFLSAGLLLSLQFFEHEYKRAQQGRGDDGTPTVTPATKNNNGRKAGKAGGAKSD